MVKDKRDFKMLRLTTALRSLMGGEPSGPELTGCDYIFFLASPAPLEGGCEDFEMKLMAKEADSGRSMVALRFGSSAIAPPRRVIAGVPGPFCGQIVPDCVIWLGEQDTSAVLVPADPGQNFHIGVGPYGLEWRAGRPSAFLGAGIARARARMMRIARELPPEDLDEMFDVVG